MTLSELLSQLPRIPGWAPPEIIDASTKQGESRLAQLLASGAIRSISDQIGTAIQELYDIHYPDKIDDRDEEQLKRYQAEYIGHDIVQYGNWVHYPWSGELVHFPTEQDLTKLRSSRNRNLITEGEQKSLRQATIAIAGLSVGSNIIDCLLRQGIGGTYILIDNDVLEPTNLNRIHASYNQVGQHKVHVVAKKISDLDPYIKQVHYLDGLHEQNLDEIFHLHRPDVFIDEMDHLKMKIMARKKAKDLGIPVLMAADDGDSVVVEVERYDTDQNLEILHGRIPKRILEKILSTDHLARHEVGFIIGKYFVGPENIPVRMYQSLTELGKTLPSWPQLGGTATLAGVIVAYCTRKIFLQQPLKSGRFVIGPDEALNPEIHSSDYRQAHQEYISKLQNEI